MTLLLTILGGVLNVLVLRDIFHTLFHPSGSGALSNWGARYLWRLCRLVARRRPQVLTLVGPIVLVAVIATWTLGLVIGWALIYWPHLTEAFLLAPGLDPARNSGFLDAVYVSLVTLATLGYGEITPQVTWLRMIMPVEALIGFALMTAAISWILSVYPVLGRRRHLAREIALLHHTRWWQDAGAANGEPEVLAGMLLSLAEQIITVRGDLAQFPVTYYFHPSDQTSSLTTSLPAITDLTRAAQQHGSATIRFQADLLLQAIEDLAGYVGATFLGQSSADVDQLLRAYAEDHLDSE